MRGIYTAGVIDVFLKRNIHVDAIIGTSAGALFGINYVSNQKERAIRYNKHYCKRKDYMGFYSLITTGNIMNKEFCFDKLVNELDPFDFETFKNSKTKFYVTVTNLETGEAEYPQIKDFNQDMEYLRASGSMPCLSKIVEINGNKYLDGGIADAIPVEKCKELGYDKIIVVLTRPLDYRKKKSNMFLASIMYKKYPNLIKIMEKKYENYNNTVEKIIDMENKKEIFVIRPSKTIKVGRIEKDENKLQEMYNLGIEDCKSCIKDLKKFIGIE